MYNTYVYIYIHMYINIYKYENPKPRTLDTKARNPYLHRSPRQQQPDAPYLLLKLL